MLDLPHLEYLLRFAGSDRKRLVVIMSQDTKPVFERNDFGCPTLCVWERGSQSYFVRGADLAVDQLRSSILGMGIDDVVFFGTSKGGFGALLWGTLLAQSDPQLRVTVVAFSPQTQLFPQNPGLAFPSYAAMLRDADEDAELRGDLERFGTIVVPERHNLQAHVIYPSRVPEDTAEATRITGSSVSYRPLPLSTHNTIFPFTGNMADREEVERGADALMRAAGHSKDLASTLLHAKREELVEEYHALGALPGLVDTVLACADSHPAGRGARREPRGSESDGTKPMRRRPFWRPVR